MYLVLYTRCPTRFFDLRMRGIVELRGLSRPFMAGVLDTLITQGGVSALARTQLMLCTWAAGCGCPFG